MLLADWTDLDALFPTCEVRCPRSGAAHGLGLEACYRLSGCFGVAGSGCDAEDRYGAYPEELPVDPLGPARGADRIRRGCSWANVPEHCWAADRSADPPGDRDRDWGFRLVRSAS